MLLGKYGLQKQNQTVFFLCNLNYTLNRTLCTRVLNCGCGCGHYGCRDACCCSCGVMVPFVFCCCSFFFDFNSHCNCGLMLLRADCNSNVAVCNLNPCSAPPSSIACDTMSVS